MKSNTEAFSYTYSASQQEEVKRIKQKYLSPEADKMEQLRRLDASATHAGTIAALVIGIISALVFGVGMCCTMVWTQYFTPGIIIGIVGIVGLCIAYPVYASTTKRARERLAPEIMRLSEELVGHE